MGRKYLHLMQHQVYTWSNRSKYRHWSLWAIEERDRNVTLIGMIYKTFSREKCEEIQIPFCICSYSLLVFMFFLQTPSYKCKLLQKQCQQKLYNTKFEIMQVMVPGSYLQMAHHGESTLHQKTNHVHHRIHSSVECMSHWSQTTRFDCSICS